MIQGKVSTYSSSSFESFDNTVVVVRAYQVAVSNMRYTQSKRAIKSDYTLPESTLADKYFISYQY